MASDNTSGKRPASKAPRTNEVAKKPAQELNTVPATKKSARGAKSAIGGTAVPGAKSTQPKQISEEASQQQQQLESYNRDMRRRMERMGYSDAEQRVKTVASVRKKRADRLKERREQQLAHIKKTLPGGKIDTSPRRVYFMVAGVAAAIVVVIVVFAILRATGHL